MMLYTHRGTNGRNWQTETVACVFAELLFPKALGTEKTMTDTYAWSVPKKMSCSYLQSSLPVLSAGISGYLEGGNINPT